MSEEKFDEERLSRPASGIVLALASLLLQALRLMFIVGCQFDERFPYERIEALARQSLAFPRLSMKRFFGSHRTCPQDDRVRRERGERLCRTRGNGRRTGLVGLDGGEALGTRGLWRCRGEFAFPERTQPVLARRRAGRSCRYRDTDASAAGADHDPL